MVGGLGVFDGAGDVEFFGVYLCDEFVCGGVVDVGDFCWVGGCDLLVGEVVGDEVCLGGYWSFFFGN